MIFRLLGIDVEEKPHLWNNRSFSFHTVYKYIKTFLTFTKFKKNYIFNPVNISFCISNSLFLNWLRFLKPLNLKWWSRKTTTILLICNCYTYYICTNKSMCLCKVSVLWFLPSYWKFRCPELWRHTPYVKRWWLQFQNPTTLCKQLFQGFSLLKPFRMPQNVILSRNNKQILVKVGLVWKSEYFWWVRDNFTSSERSWGLKTSSRDWGHTYKKLWVFFLNERFKQQDKGPLGGTAVSDV